MKSILAWHFIKPNRRERFDPHRLIITGKTLDCNPDNLELCRYGLHASIKPLDALQYLDWGDAIICRVRLSGIILEQSDKLCAEKRTVIWMAKCDRTLHEFAVWCALQTLKEYEKEYPNDNRPRLAIEAKQKWLNGKLSDSDLSAARSAADSAAESAAESAAWSAARSVAWSAARSATCSAARSAARSAACSAVCSAVCSAARSAARSAQNKQLKKMLLKLKGKK